MYMPTYCIPAQEEERYTEKSDRWWQFPSNLHMVLFSASRERREYEVRLETLAPPPLNEDLQFRILYRC